MIFHFLPVEEEIIAQGTLPSQLAVRASCCWCSAGQFYFWFGPVRPARSEGQSADEGHLWAISNQQAQPSNQGNNGTPSLAELLPQFYSSLAFTTTPELVRPVPVHRWQGGAYIIYVDTYVSLSHIRSLVPHYYIVEWCEGQPSRGVRTLIIQARQSQHADRK